MVMYYQPIIATFAQNHGETCGRFSNLAVSCCGERIEPSHVGVIVIEYDYLVVVDHNFIAALC